MRNQERKKIILFGSEHCAHCGPAKDLLTEKQVKFTYVDITADMPRLQMFLKIRDESPAYTEIRGSGKIGIPSLQVNDVEYVLNGTGHVQQLIDELGLVW